MLNSLLNQASFLDPDRKQVLVVKPSSNVEFSELITNEKESLIGKIKQHGGALLRDFNISTVSKFDELVKSFSKERRPYMFRSTPRTHLGENIYTATEYPAHRIIPLHNEFSYLDTWPEFLIFFCMTPPKSGGQTLLANSHFVYKNLPENIISDFKKNNVLYKRLYTQAIDLPWQEVFQTNDKNAVNAYCKKHSITAEWSDGIIELTTKHVRPALLNDPSTSNILWFNQAHLFHETNLTVEDRNEIYNAIGTKQLTRESFFGNGSPIPPGYIQAINESFKRETISFDWKKNDVLIIDNSQMAHGRNYYQGNRKILVAMI